MASPRRTVQVFRTLTVLALTSAAVGLPASRGEAVPGPGTPTTCAESRRQFAANAEAAEKIAEQLNDARVARAKMQKAFSAADKRARTVKAEYGKLADDFRKIVSGELKAAPAGQFAMFFSSTSPKDFADQMALMDYVAGRKGEKIDKLSVVRAAATKAQAEAQAKLAARVKVEKEISAKASDLRKRGTQLNALLSRLCAADDPTQAAVRASRDVARLPIGPVSSAAKKAVDVALAQLGDAYVWGASGPDAFDCSGLTSYAWAAAGVQLPHSSSAQYGVGQRISRSQVRAGDLVFFYSPIHHVGIAINNTQMVHAPTFGSPVQIASIDSSPFVGATRLG
ncbi:MAG TPA: C40 family peptidase [Mycobacteriales bacterium]|nr:C40 family peptidase [Mycobacteriales bacterium]